MLATVLSSRTVGQTAMNKQSSRSHAVTPALILTSTLTLALTLTPSSTLTSTLSPASTLSLPFPNPNPTPSLTLTLTLDAREVHLPQVCSRFRRIDP